MTRFITFAGYKISQQTAGDLNYLYRWAQTETIARRLWRELLTIDDRVTLGGKFAPAFRNYDRTVGIYRHFHPRVSIERATLEVLYELGVLQPVRYRRLVLAIGEKPDVVPDVGCQPAWDANRGMLFLRGQLIRTVRQPGRACNIVGVLNAFERLGWPNHVPRREIGKIKDQALRQAVSDVNRGLQMIRFQMDGYCDGVVWSSNDKS